MNIHVLNKFHATTELLINAIFFPKWLQFLYQATVPSF